MTTLSWRDADGAATEWADGQTDGLLRVGPGTDYFVDPRGIDSPTASSPLWLTDPGPGPFQFSAQLRVQNVAAFDAVALFVYENAVTWGKFAIERSPAGEDLLTTVITRGVSDDANGPVVDTVPGLWLRVSRIGQAYAFHDSIDGHTWSLRRLFTLGDTAGHRVGFTIQSPTGTGLEATVVRSQWVEAELTNQRDGS